MTKIYKLDLESTDPDGQSLSFEYPSITRSGGYIRPFVKIEIGEIRTLAGSRAKGSKLRQRSSETLLKLKQNTNYKVTGLFTTVNEAYDRVAMHSTRYTLLHCKGRRMNLACHWKSF